MPEITEDATFLIATSWQALGRANQGDERALTCNCTVVIVFAAFYLEANLTHIIDYIGDIDEMKEFVNQRYPGLYPKLSWYFNRYVLNGKATSKDDFYHDEFRNELFDRFYGFEEIYKFRNNIAHGAIDKSLTNLEDAKRLRGNVKIIVQDLFEISESVTFTIPRVVTYSMAISSDYDSNDG